MVGMDLTTDRLRLRAFVAEDFDWLHPICADPAATRWTDWGPNAPEDTHAFLAEAMQAGKEPTFHLWAVTLADGTGIGSSGMHVRSHEDRRAAIGYLLDPRHWGRGYGTEVARALLAAAQTTYGMHRVEATCHPDNVASARVLEKAGLTLEGRLRDHRLVRGQWRDSLLFAAIGPD